jgi:cation diffusion facilitator family transporter
VDTAVSLVHTRVVTDCCAVTADLTERQRRVLRIVLWINGAMFLVEAAAGLLAHSTALLADSVDMLGDAIVYGFSLWVVARGHAWQARGALLKGVVMAAFGIGVFVQAALKLIGGVVPVATTMGVVGALALVANVVCLALLWARRTDDINMRSAWTCSLNDVFGNVGVLAAGAGVAWTGRGWPDITVGLAVALLFFVSAVRVIRAARRQLRPMDGADASSSARSEAARRPTDTAWPPRDPASTVSTHR